MRCLRLQLGCARPALAALALLALTCWPRQAQAQPASKRDGVYGRFDGDLDLGLALGAELGSAGDPAPALRASAHYFSIAGVYAGGRLRAGDSSAPSLFDVGVDLRPLFVPRWAKGFQAGPSFLDLTLDSLSLSLGGFWTKRAARRPGPGPNSPRGFELGLGFGVPLMASATGLWLEARGLLRYPDAEPREEAVLLALAWHGFVTTPLSEPPR